MTRALIKHLQHFEDRGYPAEYLLSRIRGRRSRLISDWKLVIYESTVADFLSSNRYQGFVRELLPENMWRNLLKEYRWVYFQMNAGLREMFASFFLYVELRTLFICLRHIKHGSSRMTADLLEVSLLSNEIKNVLMSAADAHSAVKGIENIFSTVSDRFAGLAEAFNSSGMRAVEQMFTDTYLAAAAEAKLDPLLKEFFSLIIDSRNIMITFKNLTIEKNISPSYVSGGRIAKERFVEVVQKLDFPGLSSLIHELFKIKIDMPGTTNVEMGLYKGITRFLSKEGRKSLEPGLILDYLWRCSLEVMNLNVLLYGKDLDREVIREELCSNVT